MTPEEIDSPVLTARQMVEWKIRQGILPCISAPRNVIFCFQSSLVRTAIQGKRAQKLSGLGEVYVLHLKNARIMIACSAGVGAPAAVALLEELVAFGAERVLAIGLAGSLQPTLAAGDLVLIDRAVRGEGTSKHYMPPGRSAVANDQLLQALCRTLQAQGERAQVGSSWTTDAPFREMWREVEQYRKEGVLTVEMEAAALYAAGQALGAQVAAACAIADSLDGMHSPLDFDHDRAERGLKVLLDAAIQLLAEVK